MEGEQDIPEEPKDAVDQLRDFCTELEALVVRFRREYDLPAACYIGSLEIIKASLMKEILEDEE